MRKAAKKRIMAAFLTFIMAFTMIPWTNINARAADGIKVSEICIQKTFNENLQIAEWVLRINGSNLSNVDAAFLDGANVYVLKNPAVDLGGTVLQFNLEENKIGDILYIGGYNFNVGVSTMPGLKDISPRVQNGAAEGDHPNEGDLQIVGERFSIISSPDDKPGAGEDAKIYAQYGKDIDPHNIDPKDTTNVIINNNTITVKDAAAQPGLQDVNFWSEKIQNQDFGAGSESVNISVLYKYQDIFRIYDKLNISDDITMFPNSGPSASLLKFIARKLSNTGLDIFFLNDEEIQKSNSFTNVNKLKNFGVKPLEDGSQYLLAEVPALKQGEYNVVITNAVGDTDDPNTKINSIKVLKDKFRITEQGNKLSISSVLNDISKKPQGPDTSHKVDIYGSYLGTVNISGLELKGTPLIEIINNELHIKYTACQYSIKKDQEVEVDVEKAVKVNIGGVAEFREDEKGEIILGSTTDIIPVHTQDLTGSINEDTYINVMVETTTILTETTADPKKYTFNERCEKENAYLILPSKVLPEIDNVVPDKIQVEKDGKVSKDILLAINGERFRIYADQDGKRHYPKIQIGKKLQLDKNAESDLEMYILDKNSNVMDGSEGKQEGCRILLKIKADKEIDLSEIGTRVNVILSNPVRNSDELGDPVSGDEDAMIEFVSPNDAPIIDKVEPNIDTVNGGKDIVITGSSFLEGIKVFLDGSEITELKREIDKNGEKILLKFKSPPGRKGTTQLLVMNPSGGIDVADFTYVESFDKDPQIIEFHPNKGEADTMVLLDGDNFLKPDTTVKDLQGMGVYSLIGTRVLFDGHDINRYTTDMSLQEYNAPEQLFLFTLDVNKKLEISPFYRAAIISTGNGDNEKFYSLKVDKDKNPVISGEQGEFLFKVSRGSIKAYDQQEEEYDVEVNENSLTLKKDGVSFLNFNVQIDNKLFSIGRKNDGTRYLELADYYQSVILEDGAGRYYIISRDQNGNVTLSHDQANSYVFKLDNEDIIAVKDKEYKLNINPGTIEILDDYNSTLTIKTLYESTNGIINGNRVKVINKNQLIFTVPKLDGEDGEPWGKSEDWYDLSVINPDTSIDTRTGQSGFYYFKQPQSRPQIFSIIPDSGSMLGGFNISIVGEDFEDSSKVYIDGVEISAEDTVVSLDKKNISVKVPQYKGDFEINQVTVPVVVLNEDGGSAGIQDGFTYIKPGSHPRIDKILPDKVSAAGGDLLTISGYDFRYAEPREGSAGIVQDINGNGEWDDLLNNPIKVDADGSQVDYREPLALDHLIYNEFYSSPILPRVYIGGQAARIVEFSKGCIKVIVPSGSTGTVDVYLVNNDSGVSNKVSLTYEGSNPSIKSIVPGEGNKRGGEKVEINGNNFFNSKMDIYRDSDEIDEDIKMPAVKFADISNKDISIEQENSGQINNNHTGVNLAGGLTLDYYGQGVQGNAKLPEILVRINEDQKIYEKLFKNYDNTEKYIQLKALINRDNPSEHYQSNELIKINIILDTNDYRMIVERGYSPSTTLIRSDQIAVETPSYFTVGVVPVTVINPDGGTATGTFEYKNPQSNPVITNISRDSKQPRNKIVNNQEVRILQMNYKGKSVVSVFGIDFRENANIQIGDIVAIEPGDISYTLPNKVSFTMPEVEESQVGKPLRLMVINEDGGVAASDDLPAGQKSIYIQFTKGETSPEISGINPNLGPAAGGTRVKIEGKDFRGQLDGYEEEKLEVYFGEIKADDVELIDYKTISVLTPANLPGAMKIRVENPDGEISISDGDFTYISTPKITAVVDAADPTENTRVRAISINGGKEIKIKGTGFMEGARVVFVPEISSSADKSQADFYLLQEKTVDGQQSVEVDPYILESGTDGSTIKFVDAETLVVTTPPGKLEGKGIIVINPDKGGSELYEDIVYELPVIESPQGVKAEIIHDSYNDTDLCIKVHWLEVIGAEEYEIYVVENNQSQFIGTTAASTFIYEELEEDSWYKFIVKAVGDFGASKPSAESNRVRTGSDVGAPDTDGGINENTEQIKNGDTAIINVGTRDYDDKVIKVDLTRGELAGSREVIVVMPAKAVSSSRAQDVEINGEDFMLRLNPRVFEVDKLYRNRREANAGVRFKIAPSNNKSVQAGAKILSSTYLLEAQAFAGQDMSDIDYLTDNIYFALDFDQRKARLRRLSDTALYRYDEYTQKWESSYYWKNTGFNGPVGINRLGRYAVMGNR